MQPAPDTRPSAPPRGTPFPADDLKALCRQNNWPLATVRGQQRDRASIRIRHRAVRVFAARWPNLSLTQIGRVFHRHHTSILSVPRKAKT